MKTKKILQELCIAMLVILFVYTASIKLMKFEEHSLAMKAQPLLPWLQNFLIYAVPFSEIIAVILLAIAKLRRVGLFLTTALLISFTGYVVLVNLNYYGRIPCSCGGVISSFSWQQHLVFNMFFVIISVVAIYLDYQIDKNDNKKQNLGYSGEQISLH
ncbi:MauE/DoxX family redox-associated membrane protein [Chitinophaga arvensicola]|uniref:Methylamine utilisation protein MauE domain-containing protein n=1 Tax=Chitinophaga arvensicola TaxID=29529 RepID=A0A1I0S983_9BACT|nr:MauE/DoxX family redox-associated membrane protein [Chitinophaga arvensicola]SEW51592.1 hypothetical protein SAMN04488122_4352 [Chitinophaga arvensicola]